MGDRSAPLPAFGLHPARAAADSSQTRRTIGIYYTFLGHDRFGLVD